MNLIEDITSLRTAQQAWKAAQQKIALVPTMGNLHAGHFRLVEVAKQTGYTVVVSIFVNPLQFGPTEDWDRYPRTLSEDISHLNNLGVDAMFAPSVSVLYPNGQTTTLVQPGALANDLCGVSRPTHFAGVATVVAKLFNLIQPQCAIFGEKDRQQVVIIQRMVEDLNFPVEIITVPTVREPDGLALSSRNRYLSEAERKIAPQLYETLCWVKQQLSVTRDYPTLCEQAIQRLSGVGFVVDYLTIRHKHDLTLPNHPENNPESTDTNKIHPAEDFVVLTAASLGSTRLIDNV